MREDREEWCWGGFKCTWWRAIVSVLVAAPAVHVLIHVHIFLGVLIDIDIPLAGWTWTIFSFFFAPAGGTVCICWCCPLTGECLHILDGLFSRIRDDAIRKKGGLLHILPPYIFQHFYPFLLLHKCLEKLWEVNKQKIGAMMIAGADDSKRWHMIVMMIEMEDPMLLLLKTTREMTEPQHSYIQSHM